jgi:hypothetical protein
VLQYQYQEVGDQELDVTLDQFNVVFRSIGGYAVMNEPVISTTQTDFDSVTEIDLTSTTITEPVVTTVEFNEQKSPDEEGTLDGKVYLFGYNISVVDDNSCIVTVISQFSSEFQKLDVDINFCRKLKLFIEELTEFTDLEHQPKPENESKRHKIVFGF